MLDILITGFPNCGTSFLAHLVAEAGLSMGSEDALKGADDHNRWGYWEHLPLRRVSWALLGGRFDVTRMPQWALSRHEPIAVTLETLGTVEGVEAYKDNALPLVHRSFPPKGHVIIIRREPEVVYERYYAEKMTLQGFMSAWIRYWGLAFNMAQEREVLPVSYEAFAECTEGNMRRVCKFIGQPWRDELLGIWRPR